MWWFHGQDKTVSLCGMILTFFIVQVYIHKHVCPVSPTYVNSNRYFVALEGKLADERQRLKELQEAERNTQALIGATEVKVLEQVADNPAEDADGKADNENDGRRADELEDVAGGDADYSDMNGCGVNFNSEVFEVKASDNEQSDVEYSAASDVDENQTPLSAKKGKKRGRPKISTQPAEVVYARMNANQLEDL